MATSGQLRTRAHGLRTAAQDLDARAAALDRIAGEIDLVLNPVHARFTNHVWAGPAAGRAWMGYLDASQQVRRVAREARQTARDFRSQARRNRNEAWDLVRWANRLDAQAAAEAAAAAATSVPANV